MLRVKNPLHAKVLQHVRHNVNRRHLLIGGGVMLVMFVAANLAVSAVYRQRMFPNSYIDLVPVGNKTYSVVEKLNLIPKELIFTAGTASKKISINQLGAVENWPATKSRINLSKPLLPIAGLFGRKQYSLAIDYDMDKNKKLIEQLTKDLSIDSKDAAIDVSEDQAKLTPSSNGQTLSSDDITAKLYQGITGGTITVPVKKNHT